MPAMHYTLAWPDGQHTVAYSPSLVIQDHFQVGLSYTLDDFEQRLRAATDTANARVQAKFGFVCSRANDQLDTLLQALARCRALPAGGATPPQVRVLAFQAAD